MRSGLSSPDPSFIASRVVGESTVTVVSEGAIRWAPRFPVSAAEWRRAEPGTDAGGRSWFGLNVVLIHLGSSRIVIDPAFDAPGSRFERTFAKSAGLEVRRSPGLDVALDLLGFDPADVTQVVITHPHGDHIGGLTRVHDGSAKPRFPNARHFLGRDDWDDARLVSVQRQPLVEVARRGLLDLVSGNAEIAPGVTLVPAPGETSGHHAVRIESEGETAWVLGDLIHHACEVAHPEWAPPHADAARVHATRLSLFPMIAGSNSLVVAPHLPFPGWGHFVAEGSQFRFVPA
jgi:glyoxylase-like metal-dependent hydrolase (beta-lactamase superfamily II)